MAHFPFSPDIRIWFCQQLGFQCGFAINASSTEQGVKHLMETHGFVIREGRNVFLHLTPFQPVADTLVSRAPRGLGGHVANKQLWTVTIVDLDGSYKSDKSGPTFLLFTMLQPEDKSFVCVCISMSGHSSDDELDQYRVTFVIESQKNEVTPMHIFPTD